MEGSLDIDAHCNGKPNGLLAQVRAAAKGLGFSSLAVVALDLRDGQAQAGLQAWLSQQFHGDMHFMQEHAHLRGNPAALVPQAASALMVTMPYLSVESIANHFELGWRELREPAQAYVSLYARGRDYHKVVRQRLATLATQLETLLGPFGHRAFCDSAPVMEVELAQRAGLGWRGKHTLMLRADQGSMFFLGAIYTDIALEQWGPEAQTEPVLRDGEHCGSCQRCIEVCPTQAITAPFRLDARRCISYLTIELKDTIPLEMRRAIGNRILGCDDCQLVCPWNKFAVSYTVPDFAPRSTWSAPQLLEVFAWSEAEFLKVTEGSAIRRVGHARWQRNCAVALGNWAELAGSARVSLRPLVRSALQERLAQCLCASTQTEAMVKEHVRWALECWHAD
jgi:epoxyqueuosine reductase